MTENEFLLVDRIQKIKSINEQYDLENNSYISFSGGRDSTVLSALMDEALPGNNIPRVYADTGIELNEVRKFVIEKSKIDNRIVIIKPSENIKKILETYGYPFKSKSHSETLARFQSSGLTSPWVRRYIGIKVEGKNESVFRPCPKKLKYQFSDNFKLRISDQCCFKLKEEPLNSWSQKNNRPYSIVAILRAEGGRRMKAQCLAFSGNKLKRFQPFAVVSNDFIDFLIDKYSIELCKLYYEPYNFTRTGCKGCPFAINLQDELDTLEKLLPAERKQCELIWKPVYDEYRRIGYRLRDRGPFDLL